MNLKAIFVVVCFLGWSVVSGWFYINKIKEVGKAAALTETRMELPRIEFYANSSKPDFSKDFNDYRMTIEELVDSNSELRIIGIYDQGEYNLSEAEDLGIARALEVRGLFINIPDSLISIVSEQRMFDDRLKKYPGVAIDKLNKESVRRSGNIAVIDSDRLGDDKVTAYLKFLSIEMKDKNISLTGYPSNIISTDESFISGLDLANRVKQRLVELGFSEPRIKVNEAQIGLYKGNIGISSDAMEANNSVKVIID